MKNSQIDGFGTKLMASSKSINKIPYNYLSYAQNLRIYDGGIGPRTGFQSIYNSNTGVNQGGFSLNGSLYQVEGGKIWKIDTENGTREDIADIGYDSRVDVLVYQNTRGEFESLATETMTYNDLEHPINNVFYQDNLISLKTYTSGVAIAGQELTEDNRGFALPAVKLLQTGTPTFILSGSTNGIDVGDGIILTEGEFARTNVSTFSGSFQYEVGRYITNETAIIASNGRDVKVFDGETVTDVVEDNSGIIGYSAGRSWLASSNILKASRPVTLTNPEYSYDFTGPLAYQIIYDSAIQSLESTLGGLYVFTEEKVEYLADGNTINGLSIPIGEGGNPINNECVVSSGEKIFYLTKDLNIETVNYIPGINDAQVGDLSAQPIVNIQEYLRNLDTEQPTAFAFNNRKDNTVEFHLRTIGSGFNNVCVVYDLVNDTYNIDVGRYYSNIVKNNNLYYGFSDITSSIYQDCIGFTDNGNPISTQGITQNMGYNTPYQKLFSGFNIGGSISTLSSLDFFASIDEQEVFQDTLYTEVNLHGGTGSVAIGEAEVGGESVRDQRVPFVRQADEGRIWLYGDRFQLEFSSENLIQDWLLDSVGVRYESVNNINIENKF